MTTERNGRRALNLPETSGANNVKEFHGREGFRRFFDFYYANLMDSGGSACVFNLNERLFCEYYGEPEESNKHIARMKEMVRLRDEPYFLNLLVCEGDMYFVARKYARYRWIKKELYTPTCFYVFNDHLALVNFVSTSAPHVVLIKSKPFADSYRQLFQNTWERALDPPCSY